MRTLKPESKTEKKSQRSRSQGFFEKATWPASCLGFSVVALALGYGLIAGGHVSHLGTEISKGARGAVEVAGLAIRDISISGHKRASRQSILKAAGFDVGAPIMSFDTEKARDRIEQLDWIERARVVRLLPDRVSIEVSERQPFALWQIGGQVTVIDRTGKSLKSLNAADYPQFLQLVGKGAEKKGATLIAELKEHPDLASQVKAAVRVAERRWTLKLVQNIDIYLPEDNMRAALQEVSRLQKRYHLLGRNISRIDMRLQEKITISLRDGGHNRPSKTVPRKAGVSAL